MRFTFWPAATHSWENILELARHIETAGWDGLVYADHFMANAEDTRLLGAQ